MAGGGGGHSVQVSLGYLDGHLLQFNCTQDTTPVFQPVEDRGFGKKGSHWTSRCML